MEQGFLEVLHGFHDVKIVNIRYFIRRKLKVNFFIFRFNLDFKPNILLLSWNWTPSSSKPSVFQIIKDKFDVFVLEKSIDKRIGHILPLPLNHPNLIKSFNKSVKVHILVLFVHKSLEGVIENHLHRVNQHDKTKITVIITTLFDGLQHSSWCLLEDDCWLKNWQNCQKGCYSVLI